MAWPEPSLTHRLPAPSVGQRACEVFESSNTKDVRDTYAASHTTLVQAFYLNAGTIFRLALLGCENEDVIYLSEMRE